MASPSPSAPPPGPAVPPTRHYSRGGLITAAILTLWSLVGLMMAVSHRGEPLAPWAAFLCANAALFWRVFHPPLKFGQGFAVWFGGFIAGTSFTAFELPLLPAIAMFVVFVALGAAIFRLGLDPPPRGRAKALIGVAIAFIVLSLAGAFFAFQGRSGPKQLAPAPARPR